MISAEITEKLKKYGQEHLLRFRDGGTVEEREALDRQLAGIDFEKIQMLYNETIGEAEHESEAKIEPISYVDRKKLSEEQRSEYYRTGGELIACGQFAVVTMAGGQGTRLGHNGPKGTYDIGLKTHKSLFEIQCDRLKESSARFGNIIPWYIMTSRENNFQTESFFEDNDYFGYGKANIRFFVQNMLPMVGFDGKIICDRKNHIKEGADGHGGVFAALKTSGCYEDMLNKGIKWIFVGGIDNVLLQLADPEFIGFAEQSGEKIACKSVVKRDAKEGVGVFCRKNGKPYVIEYTEISPELAAATDDRGEFVYGDGHVLCNIFSIEAFRKMLDESDGLPYHVARKKTDFTDEFGNVIKPEKPNAFKFEAFIFDAFARFDNLAIMRTEREMEFAPVKNAAGEDSPETARKMYEAAEKLRG